MMSRIAKVTRADTNSLQHPPFQCLTMLYTATDRANILTWFGLMLEVHPSVTSRPDPPLRSGDSGDDGNTNILITIAFDLFEHWTTRFCQPGGDTKVVE